MDQVKFIGICDESLDIPAEALSYDEAGCAAFRAWLDKNNYGYFGEPRESFRGYWEDKAIAKNPGKAVIIVEDLS